MDDHLGKPIDQAELSAALTRWTSQRDAPSAPLSSEVEGAEAEGAEVEGAEAEGAEVEGAEVEGAEVEGAEVEGAEADLAGETWGVETYLMGESVLQPERWRELQNELDTEWLGDLVTLFLDEAPQLILELEAAVQRQSAFDVGEIAHKFKGSCATMSASRLAALCRSIENGAGAGDWTGITAQLEQMKPESDAARRGANQKII